MRKLRIIHELGERREGEATGLGAGTFLVTNKKGGSFSLGAPNVTKYNGLVHYDAEARAFVKTLDTLGLDAPHTLVNMGPVIERIHEHARERYALSSRALHYELEGAGVVALDFDVHRLGHEHAFGHHYEARQEGDELVVHYWRDHEYFIVIKGVQRVERIGEWVATPRPYDERRGDGGERWVYRLARLPLEDARLVVTRSRSREKALEKARTAMGEYDSIVASIEHYAAKSYHGRDGVAFAALDALATRLKGGPNGILAGLPWFHQFWSRDELIALAPFIAKERYGFVKEVLARYYELEPPLLALYPRDGLRAADAEGWLAVRTDEFLRALEERGIVDEYLTKLERAYIRERLEARLHDGLMVTGPGETWMDASYGGDGRAGACIEIQALHVRMMKLVERLGGRTKRKEVARLVREQFYRDGRLYDRKGDATQRPNLFLAYEAYPELLSRDEWRAAFDTALDELWLPWGGLASLSKKHPLFLERYTGMSDESYHRGDSWYWVNALAARCLHRVDAERYEQQIAALRAACEHDLLWQGAVGYASELSSAGAQEWGGCFAQAWSAAMLWQLQQR